MIQDDVFSQSNHDENSVHEDEEKDETEATDMNEDSNGFFVESNRIRDDIEKMKQHIERIDRLQNKIINVTGEAETRMCQQSPLF